ncbi:alanine racemase [Corynebacterium sp. TAE3-ERU12]|uniref:alanine racemase n=1 Tax=Corynebacterium sp. TAE3-ERU12 TaxID=2849491 RepID=UPI001C48F064|nr:alanine racemase [Corynebacterium sp. TAE3-ERU12]MBV7296201.1 alanine racemase [Corynebacterium sp. TAE3-ERU12]
MNVSPVPDDVRMAVAGERLPALVVDRDRVDANCTDLRARANGTTIRVASKSLRIPELIRYVLDKPGFSGVLGYTLAEALDLFDAGISDDIVVAYPTTDRVALEQLASNAQARAAITIMIDCVEHLDFLTAALSPYLPDGARVRVCLDVDASWKPLPGVHIGTHRSPTHSPQAAAELATAAANTPLFTVVGIMMYEGHIAGVGDNTGDLRQYGVRIMQALSKRELAKRRKKVVAAVEKAVGKLEFVNGGGTGSLESTCAEEAVTEAAAGSGIVGPLLFDFYRHFQPTPAEWFVLPVVRRPSDGIATAAGGGRIASGPAGAERLPQPVYPEGLSYIADEGPGEVQTPLAGEQAQSLRIGDPVWMRHAKAGEPAEHANEAVIVSGGEIIDRWATYRGNGRMYA